ncbi:MAG: glycoside hydrolase family 25 protein [Chitinophagaceae bacterium]
MAKRKKRSLLVTLVKILTGLAALSVIIFYLLDALNQPAAVRYPAFGISIPQGFEIHGIDVSRYQKNISWKEVKKMQVKQIRIGFAYIKATEGIDRIDPQFRRNWLKAEEAGLPRGAYHFFLPGKSAKAQADNFTETVRLRAGDLPPVLDVEQTNGKSVKEIKEKVQDWLRIVEAFYDVRPIIYTNAVFYETYLQDDFDDYPLWVAHYLEPIAPRIGRPWQFWQHSEQGRVNGINAAVDFNVFKGDSTAFRALLVQ